MTSVDAKSRDHEPGDLRRTAEREPDAPEPIAPTDPGWPAQVRDGEEPGSGWTAAQRGVLEDAWERHGSIREAARALGIPKSTLADRARRLGLRLR